jgi:sulfur-oxidizing protein SoxZ
MSKPRIKLPDTIRIGDTIEIKAMIAHPMETGQRREPDGRLVARNIIKEFRATFNEQPVFSAEFQPGISANPYIAFSMKVTGPGDLQLAWIDDHNAVTTDRQKLVLS